jgi:hypothetical protein
MFLQIGTIRKCLVTYITIQVYVHNAFVLVLMLSEIEFCWVLLSTYIAMERSHIILLLNRYLLTDFLSFVIFVNAILYLIQGVIQLKMSYIYFTLVFNLKFQQFLFHYSVLIPNMHENWNIGAKRVKKIVHFPLRVTLILLFEPVSP